MRNHRILIGHVVAGTQAAPIAEDYCSKARQIPAAAPCAPVPPFPPEENPILGVIYGVLLWADMNECRDPTGGVGALSYFPCKDLYVRKSRSFFYPQDFPYSPETPGP